MQKKIRIAPMIQIFLPVLQTLRQFPDLWYDHRKIELVSCHRAEISK